jgi:hypothetical protein
MLLTIYCVLCYTKLKWLYVPFRCRLSLISQLGLNQTNREACMGVRVLGSWAWKLRMHGNCLQKYNKRGCKYSILLIEWIKKEPQGMRTLTSLITTYHIKSIIWLESIVLWQMSFCDVSTIGSVNQHRRFHCWRAVILFFYVKFL